MPSGRALSALLNPWKSGRERFLFYVNDSDLWDNAGFWTNNVKIWTASAP